jgi:hypothetical protein
VEIETMLILNLDHIQADTQSIDLQNIEGGRRLSGFSYFLPSPLRSANLGLAINTLSEGPNISNVVSEINTLTVKNETFVSSGFSAYFTSFAM